MKSAVITSGDHWITIDSIEYLRGTIETIERLTYKDGEQEAVKISGSSVNASVILVNGTTIDGASVVSQSELVEFIKQYAFKSGGGAPSEGVQWDDVTGKPLHQRTTPIEQAEGQVPVYTQNGQLPVGIPEFPENAVPLMLLDNRIPADGNGVLYRTSEGVNSFKLMSPSDLTSNLGSGGDRVFLFNGTTNEFQESTAASQFTIAGSIARRTSTGQVKGDSAIDNNDLVNLGQFNTAIETKVDKQEGYGLSPEPFTQDEKDKLANVEDTKFQGQFPSEAELQANGEGGAGNYAYVDGGEGEPIHLYAWNNTGNTWDLVAGESTAETPSSVLMKYESNPDRNPFTDERRDKLDSITAIFTTALKTAYDQTVNWITANGQNLLSHLTNTNNPHNVTATQIGLGDIDERLDNKADLVDGKILLEQLPPVSEGSSLVTQVVATSTTQYITAQIPEDAPDLLRFELFIPDTLVGSFIGMRLNNNNTAIYKHVLQNVNSGSYAVNRGYSQNQLRVMSGSSGEFTGRYNIRIEGTISNVAGQLKITNGTAYLAGNTVSAAPDINNFFGSVHDTNITGGKISELRFVAMASSGLARISTGSTLKVYGIK